MGRGRAAEGAAAPWNPSHTVMVLHEHSSPVGPSTHAIKQSDSQHTQYSRLNYSFTPKNPGDAFLFLLFFCPVFFFIASFSFPPPRLGSQSLVTVVLIFGSALTGEGSRSPFPQRFRPMLWRQLASRCLTCGVKLCLRSPGQRSGHLRVGHLGALARLVRPFSKGTRSPNIPDEKKRERNRESERKKEANNGSYDG